MSNEQVTQIQIQTPAPEVGVQGSVGAPVIPRAPLRMTAGEVIRRIIKAFADVVNDIVNHCYTYGCEVDGQRDEMWEHIYTAAATASVIIERLTGMKVDISVEDRNCFENGTRHDVYAVWLGEERNYVVAEFLIRRGRDWASLVSVEVYIE